MSPIEVELYWEDVFKTSPIDEETWASWITQWLSILAEHLPEQSAYELSLRLTDDQEIQSFNAQYRGKNEPTDVLAFAALETEMTPPSDEPLYLGDVIISWETATKVAAARGHSLTTELAWLASHGVLHLLGWDHPDEDSLIAMLKLQESLLDSIDLKSPSW